MKAYQTGYDMFHAFLGDCPKIIIYLYTTNFYDFDSNLSLSYYRALRFFLLNRLIYIIITQINFWRKLLSIVSRDAVV